MIFSLLSCIFPCSFVYDDATVGGTVLSCMNEQGVVFG
jgi:hypothetical protein